MILPSNKQKPESSSGRDLGNQMRHQYIKTCYSSESILGFQKPIPFNAHDLIWIISAFLIILHKRWGTEKELGKKNCHQNAQWPQGEPMRDRKL